MTDAARDKKSRKVSMWVNPTMQQQLDELAAALNLDMSAIIRTAVAALHRQQITRK